MTIVSDTRSSTSGAIIQAAVDRIASNGLNRTTMADIGSSAGTGTATVYRHFPDTTAILWAYYNRQLEVVAAQLQSINDFSEYTLQEQLQEFYETLFEVLSDDRLFVARTANRVLVPLPGGEAGTGHPREALLDMLGAMIETAVSSGSVPEPVFENGVQHLMSAHSIAIVNYWIRDTSPHCADTSVLLDKSLGLICACLEAGLVNRSVDLAAFLFKRHAAPRIQSIINLASIATRRKHRRIAGGKND